MVPVDVSEEAATSAALESEVIKKFLGGRTPRKMIVVPGRLVNIVR
jgi:leucyl-tRNA synthetase